MTSAEFVAELKPLLEARAGLAGVAVHLAWPEAILSPAIVLIRAPVQHEVEWTAMGPKRSEEVTVPGHVRAYADTMQAAADQAATIIREIGLQVTVAPPSVGEQTLKAELSRYEWSPLLSDKGGHVAAVDYEITYLTDLI